MTTRWNTAPIIRTVQEFLSTYGRCREVTLADGPHYPVLLSIEQVPGGVPMPGPGATDSPGLRIRYRGHREDLMGLGCISREMLASASRRRFDANPHGVVLRVESKTALRRWRMIEVSYFAQSRSFAGMLPGVRTYCADWLEALTARPMLRLVVDNTQREPGSAPASRELNRRSAAKQA